LPLLLLVTGSAALRDSTDATAWAFEYIEACVSGLPEQSHVLSGGAADSPDEWARHAARTAGVAWVEYRMDGLRHTSAGAARRWHRRPHASRELQARALVKAALRAERAGWRVRVLALLAPWSTTRGSHALATIARDAGLRVELREYGGGSGAGPGQAR
jgi:hypothetical protein